MRNLIFKIHKSDSPALAEVRCIDGLLVAENEDAIWLRGIEESAIMDIKIKQLPVRNTFVVDKDDNLFTLTGLTPIDTLPEMKWQSLPIFMPVELPVSVIPGKVNEQVDIALAPSKKMEEGTALLTDLSTWKNYAETAPATRLNRLQFAVSEKNEVLVMGYPLPPLPGTEYWMTNDILLPCGYDFEIKLAAVFVKQNCNPAGDSLILFDVNGQWQKIEKNFIVPAKRSAIRLTKENKMERIND